MTQCDPTAPNTDCSPDPHRHNPQGDRLVQRARIPFDPHLRRQVPPLPRLGRQRRQLRARIRLGCPGRPDILSPAGGRLSEQGYLGHERPGHREHAWICEGAGDDCLRGTCASGGGGSAEERRKQVLGTVHYIGGCGCRCQPGLDESRWKHRRIQHNDLISSVR